MKDTGDPEYTADFVAGLEWIWGEGFLSPGGPEEVAAILEGLNIDGAKVLDIGCGLGAIDLLLVREHGAARVTGIDIEPPLIERARQMVTAAGPSERIELRLVEPGPLPFDEGAFDMETPEDTAAALEATGFTEVELRDRNEWHQNAVRDELALATREDFERLAEVIGREAAEHRLASTTAKLAVVDRGELRPLHMRGRKPTR